ncbi:MAG: hypothetical protein IH991_18485 [Planctomycetes bacterium]|nr:hypothetical protein [Planctomycetota bacterium]
MKLLNIQEAADALGYTVKGLRKIVDRSRARAQGARTRGPTICFFQTVKGAPIKFREEWIEEFIEQHTIDPTAGVANGKSRRKREKQEIAFGFDEAYL